VLDAETYTEAIKLRYRDCERVVKPQVADLAGGLVSALWELAQASGRRLWFDPSAVPIPALAARVCHAFGLDPLRAISSGALLLAASKTTAGAIRRALESDGIVCAEIGGVERGSQSVWALSGNQRRQVKAPLRDEIARVFDQSESKRYAISNHIRRRNSAAL
jgi:hydrogenase maturation factor